MYVSAAGNAAGFANYSNAVNFNYVYWLKEGSVNASANPDGNQRELADLLLLSNYHQPHWDFSTIWNAPTGSTLPTLK